MDEYEKCASEFLRRVGAAVKVRYLRTAPCEFFGSDSGENEASKDRDTYSVTVVRSNRHWRFEFHDSVFNTNRNRELIKSGKARDVPGAYDVLSCVEKSPPDSDSLEDFIFEYGYEIKKRGDLAKIERIYKGWKSEARHVDELFGDVIDEFCEVFS